MPQEKMLTFEEVNAHVEKHYKEEVHGMTAAAAGTVPKICDVYKTVRPILVLASQAFFIPEKWRNAIKSLIAALDALCPGT